MSDLSSIGRIPPASSPTIQPATTAPATAASTTGRSEEAAGREDRVELSAMARYLAKLAELPEVRMDLIEAVRAQIAAGTYETPDKIEAILEELLADLRREI